jgi:hypothetical protein
MSTRVTRPIAVVTVIGAITVAAGGFIAWFHPAGLLPSGDPISQPVRLLGERMAARNLALAAALLTALAVRADRELTALMALTALTELGDAVSGFTHADISEWAGALVILAAFTWALTRLTRQPVEGQ